MKHIFFSVLKFLNYLVFIIFCVLSIHLIILSSDLESHFIVQIIQSKFETLWVYFVVTMTILTTCFLYRKNPCPQKYMFIWAYIWLGIVALLIFPNGEFLIKLDWIGHFICRLEYRWRCTGGNNGMIYLFTLWPSYYLMGALLGWLIDFIIWRKNIK
jgi:hypothetical protein